MAGYWLKVYTEIINDPKYHRLSDAGKLAMFELMIVAKSEDKGGILPCAEDLAFYTRRPVEWWQQVIPELRSISFIVDTQEGLIIRKFADRQAAVPAPERAKRSRAARNTQQEPHETQRITHETNANAHERDGEREKQKEKKQNKKQTKTEAAEALMARELSPETVRELLLLRSKDEILLYCRAYDQKCKEDGKTTPGWLIKAIRMGWDVSHLERNRIADMRGRNGADYTEGKYSEVLAR